MSITIVAEAGINHGGSLLQALDLVDAAKSAGADIVKFQTFNVPSLLRPDDPAYDKLLSLSLPRHDLKIIAKHCERVSIEFMSTPGDLDSLKFLVGEIGVKRIKIGSDDLTYAPLVQAAWDTGLPVILSTGMATIKEIADAVWVLDNWQSDRLTLLHCVSCYPCKDKDTNLLAMDHLRGAFGVPVGYSDHSDGIVAPIAAAALGARLIEKHIMFRNSLAIDEDVSVIPSVFCDMVIAIRKISSMLGTGTKEPCAAEMENRNKFRKGKDGFRGST